MDDRGFITRRRRALSVMTRVTVENAATMLAAFLSRAARRQWAAVLVMVAVSCALSAFAPVAHRPAPASAGSMSSGSAGSGSAGSVSAGTERSERRIVRSAEYRIRYRMDWLSMTSMQAPRPRVNCRVRKCVALTFDDGPVAGTAHLLDILRAHKVRATFFVVGSQAAAHPELIRRELIEGHEIGNHSYTHPNLLKVTRARAESELARTQRLVRWLTGMTPVLLRPPYGASDRRIAGLARRYALTQVWWTVDPMDWRDRDPALVRRRVVAHARRGSVILLHDIHPTTVAAVPGIVTRLHDRGFVFVTMSELDGAGPPAPARQCGTSTPKAVAGRGDGSQGPFRVHPRCPTDLGTPIMRS